MSRFNHVRSEHDPTTKEHLTEEEARSWIRHLEKVIEKQEDRTIKAKQRNAYFAEKNTSMRRKIKRLVEKLRFLQEQHPDIDFGLDELDNEKITL